LKVAGFLLFLQILFCSSQVCAQSTGTTSAADIFKRAQPSVIIIFAKGPNGKSDVLGSGFIVKRDRVVTNHHVVEGMAEVFVVFSDGDVKAATGVVADSTEQDLVVLEVPTGSRPGLVLGDELSLQQGDPVYALGAPQGLELSLTNGIVSSFRNANGQFLIQSTAPIAHGSSGGPLFDRTGRVVGITTSMADSPGIYFSVGIGDLKRLLLTPQLVILPFDEWIKGNESKSPISAEVTTSTPNNDVDQIEDLLQKKKFDEARAALQTFSTKNPDIPLAHRLTGELSLRTGDFDGAFRELGLSVQKAPKDSIAHFYYAITLFELRRFQEALDQEKISNDLAPTPTDQPWLSLFYYAVGDYGQAEALARKVLNSDATSETALSVLAGIAYHGASSRKDNWWQYALQLSKINSGNFWFQTSIGISGLQQKQLDKSIKAFKAAEEDDFPDAVPYVYLANIYKDASEIGPANDQIKAGLASVPGDPQLLSEGVFISLAARDNSEARRRLDELRRLHPDTKTYLFTACLYYYGVGQSTSALPFCDNLTQRYPDDHTAHSNYGWAALDANQIQLAYQQFAKAYQLVSSDLDKLTDVQVIDLLWGFTIANYYSGDKKNSHKLLQTIRKNYPAAATVTGLQQMPLLWSATSMGRIEAILTEFPK
jgi:tetratricopeptide (TPR) repeat protein